VRTTGIEGALNTLVHVSTRCAGSDESSVASTFKRTIGVGTLCLVIAVNGFSNTWAVDVALEDIDASATFLEVPKIAFTGECVSSD
jgi:hypothetical protein